MEANNESLIAQTILEQLGGNRFLVMTGAHNLVYSKAEPFLSFRIGRNKSIANYVKITLESDLYNMSFGRIHGSKFRVVKEYKELEASQLAKIFTEYTGLYTKFKKGGEVNSAELGDVEKYKISYLNKDNNFKQTDKFFEGKNGYQDAVSWGRENLENFNMDMIQVVFGEGGYLQEQSSEYDVDYYYGTDIRYDNRDTSETEYGVIKDVIEKVKAKASVEKYPVAEIYRGKDFIGSIRNGEFVVGKGGRTYGLVNGQYAGGGGIESKIKYTDYYLTVNLDERGEYSATVYNPNDEAVYQINTGLMNELVQDGFLKYKADEDLDRLARHLMRMSIIPNGSQIYSEEYYNDKIIDKYLDDEVMEDGGAVAESGVVDDYLKKIEQYELAPNPQHKYQNIINRWLEDNKKEFPRYKLAVALMLGESSPDEKLGGIEYEKYARMLRGLDSIVESKHEMAWRTENYSLAEAERWAEESVKELFVLKNTSESTTEKNPTKYMLWVTKYSDRTGGAWGFDTLQEAVNYAKSAGIFRIAGNSYKIKDDASDAVIMDKADIKAVLRGEKNISEFMSSSAGLVTTDEYISGLENFYKSFERLKAEDDNGRYDYYYKSSTYPVAVIYENNNNWIIKYDDESKGKAFHDTLKSAKNSLYNDYMIDRKNKLSKTEQPSSGLYVAVGESKDGYWTIMSKPTTKESAEQMLGGLPSGEIGKVVSVEEAKAHKKIVGEEYLNMSEPAEEVSEPKENPRSIAVGKLTGGKVERIEGRGYEFIEGNLVDKSPEYWDLVGMVTGSLADRLLGSGITIRKKEVENKMEVPEPIPVSTAMCRETPLVSRLLDKVYRFSEGDMSLRKFLLTRQLLYKTTYTRSHYRKEVSLNKPDLKAPKEEYTFWYNDPEGMKGYTGVDVPKKVYDCYTGLPTQEEFLEQQRLKFSEYVAKGGKNVFDEVINGKRVTFVDLGYFTFFKIEGDEKIHDATMISNARYYADEFTKEQEESAEAVVPVMETTQQVDAKQSLIDAIEALEILAQDGDMKAVEAVEGLKVTYEMEYGQPYGEKVVESVVVYFKNNDENSSSLIIETDDVTTLELLEINKVDGEEELYSNWIQPYIFKDFYNELSKSYSRERILEYVKDLIKKGQLALYKLPDVKSTTLETIRFKDGGEILVGGKADFMSTEDIADLHGVSIDHILDQLVKGIRVEGEHTFDMRKRVEIAKDHLVEDKDYYTKLEKMESGDKMSEGGFVYPKNLAQLKKYLQRGVKLKRTFNLHKPEFVGQTVVVNKVQTNGLYLSNELDDKNYGLWIEFPKSEYMRFEPSGFSIYAKNDPTVRLLAYEYVGENIPADFKGANPMTEENVTSFMKSFEHKTGSNQYRFGGKMAGCGCKHQKSVVKLDVLEGTDKKSASGVIITALNTGRILMLKRAEGDHNGKWSIVGGKMEGDEFPHETAIREVEEETGIKLKAVKYLDRTEHPDYTYYYYSATIPKEVEVTLDSENSDYKWVAGEDVKDNAHPHFVKYLRSRELKAV